MLARADRHGPAPDADFRVDAFPAPPLIHVDAAGRQHVVLKSARRRVTLCVHGAPIMVGPVRMTFEFTGLPALFAAQRNVNALQDLHAAHSGKPTGVQPWTVTGLELRDALIALDAHRACASHRDVATMMYGSDKVEADWIAVGCDLKDYVRRCRSRGIRLMQGGYRHLLR